MVTILKCYPYLVKCKLQFLGGSQWANGQIKMGTYYNEMDTYYNEMDTYYNKMDTYYNEMDTYYNEMDTYM